MARFVRNQCMKVPGGGIMRGYCFVRCAVRSSALRLGPKCLGVGRRSRWPCDGGVNFSGRSSTRGFGGERVLEAWRCTAIGLRDCSWRWTGALKLRGRSAAIAGAELRGWRWDVGTCLRWKLSPDASLTAVKRQEGERAKLLRVRTASWSADWLEHSN